MVEGITKRDLEEQLDETIRNLSDALTKASGCSTFLQENLIEKRILNREIKLLERKTALLETLIAECTEISGGVK